MRTGFRNVNISFVVSVLSDCGEALSDINANISAEISVLLQNWTRTGFRNDDILSTKMILFECCEI